MPEGGEDTEIDEKAPENDSERYFVFGVRGYGGFGRLCSFVTKHRLFKHLYELLLQFL